MAFCLGCPLSCKGVGYQGGWVNQLGVRNVHVPEINVPPVMWELLESRPWAEEVMGTGHRGV